jgi:hypothetical protein
MSEELSYRMSQPVAQMIIAVRNPLKAIIFIGLLSTHRMKRCRIVCVLDAVTSVYKS